jgi:hypothetical protein
MLYESRKRRITFPMSTRSFYDWLVGPQFYAGISVLNRDILYTGTESPKYCLCWYRTYQVRASAL